MNQEEFNHVHSEWGNFLTLPGEKLLVAKRQHWYILLTPLIALGILSFLAVTTAFFLFTVFLQAFPLFISSILLILNGALLFTAKSIAEWYFHIYIVTTRKILEVSYIPLSSFAINGVLLDQVKPTEIDFRIQGFINQFLDIGNIVITFDRPTHQDELIFANIQHCRKIANYLSNVLIGGQLQSSTGSSQMWYQSKVNKRRYSLQDIYSQKDKLRLA